MSLQPFDRASKPVDRLHLDDDTALPLKCKVKISVNIKLAVTERQVVAPLTHERVVQVHMAEPVESPVYDRSLLEIADRVVSGVERDRESSIFEQKLERLTSEPVSERRRVLDTDSDIRAGGRAAHIAESGEIL